MAQQNNNQSEIDVGQLSFERAIEELESIVRRLEDGKVPLEESVAIYERGEALKRRCEDLLRQAEARVQKITLDASGIRPAPSRLTSNRRRTACSTLGSF
jgi:exodeoxyribonuclease VII, small subunit